MSLIYTVLVTLPSFLLGVVLVCIFGLPLAYRRGRARTEKEVHVEEGLLLIRDHHVKPLAIGAEPALHPLVEETLPAQFGTRAEHDRRLAIAAKPNEPRQKAAAGLWVRLDRLASTPRLDPLCAFLGRHERRWVHHNDLVLARRTKPASSILTRLAIERETGLLPILAEHGKAKGGFVKPGPFYVGEPPPIDVAAYTDDKVTAPAVLGHTDEGPIPVAHIGELVEAT